MHITGHTYPIFMPCIDMYSKYKTVSDVGNICLTFYEFQIILQLVTTSLQLAPENTVYENFASVGLFSYSPDTWNTLHLKTSKSVWSNLRPRSVASLR